MVKLTPYINVPNALEAIEFYKKIFGVNVVSRTQFTPNMPGLNVPADFDFSKSTMHAVLDIGGANLYISDSMGHETSGSNRVSISLEPDSEQQINQIWAKVKDTNCTITMEMQKEMWGALFGMFTDPFGVNWMLNFQVEPMKPPFAPEKAPARKRVKRSKKVEVEF